MLISGWRREITVWVFEGVKRFQRQKWLGSHSGTRRRYDLKLKMSSEPPEFVSTEALERIKKLAQLKTVAEKRGTKSQFQRKLEAMLHANDPKARKKTACTIPPTEKAQEKHLNGRLVRSYIQLARVA